VKKSVQLSRVWNNPRREIFSQTFLSFLSGDEFLDTDRLRQLDYGNLVLRRQMHHYLGSGVLFSIALLLLFWFVTFNWDDVASAGRRSSGKALGDSYELVTAMVQLVPPPSLSASVAASPVTRPAVSSSAGKVAMVSEDQAPLAHPYATQSEIKQELQNQEVQGALADVGAGSGSGRGSSESSGIEGLGDDGAIFGACEKMPAFLEQKKPVYPEPARLAGITGKVLVKVLIGADGHPVKAMIMKRIPAECLAFDTVALKSVIESTYSPAIQNGRAVKVWCLIPVGFQLTDE
jgi:protein TonB